MIWCWREAKECAEFTTDPWICSVSPLVMLTMCAMGPILKLDANKDEDNEMPTITGRKIE